MKILFLDMDGVMNNYRYNSYWCKMFGRGVSDCIDPLCMLQLNRIIDVTGCDVVISSSWRRWLRDGFDLAAFEMLLSTHGFCGKVVGATSTRRVAAPGETERSKEIRQYLLDNPSITAYAVLDDDTEPIENFVHVNNDVGLSFQDAEKAIRLLLGKNDQA